MKHAWSVIATYAGAIIGDSEAIPHDLLRWRSESDLGECLTDEEMGKATCSGLPHFVKW
jgi:hypothetical protein